MAKSYCIQAIAPQGQIAAQQAHMGIITSLEMTTYGGMQILFSGGLDGKIKAWTFEGDTLKEMDKKDIEISVNALAFCGETFLVAGTSSGEFYGWSLDTNNIEKVQGHTTAISQMYVDGSFLISGDSMGVVHVRDFGSNFNLVMQADPAQLQNVVPQPQMDPNHKPKLVR